MKEDKILPKILECSNIRIFISMKKTLLLKNTALSHFMQVIKLLQKKKIILNNFLMVVNLNIASTGDIEIKLLKRHAIIPLKLFYQLS